MSQVIASTYEIIKEIGAGGGGVVYLAYHQRLNKKVVLKADKRGTAARLASLRREVDVLKELRHKYIPQVYDFFVHEGTVYTVIDYVEGESLDKPLKRGERFSQPQVIHWAVQLLEALCYLHSPTHGDPPRGFVHGDIKPANIMRTTGDNICLIDFNIALALGEERLVGYSPGYASPEHYGLDFSSVSVLSREASSRQQSSSREKSSAGQPENADGRSAAQKKNGKQPDNEETLDSGAMSGTGDSGEKDAAASSSGERYGTSAKKKIVPDVRSDIYSLGATLYHFLCGVRPARDAHDVVPLSPKEFSPQVVKIITKAMNPNPDLRYQTAEEMLDAFTHLRERDDRVRKRKRRNAFVYSTLLCLFAAGAMVSFIGLKRMQTKEKWLKLAEYSENALREGDSSGAIDYALQTFPEGKSILQPDYIAEGQRALTNAVGIYDLSDGYKIYETVNLPSHPFFLELSPDGKTAACVYAWSVRIFDTVTCETLAELPVEESALAEVRFLDNNTIIYAGKGGIREYDILQKKELWSGGPSTAISVSGDGKRIAAVYKDQENAVVYDSASGEILYTVDFQGRHQRVVSNDNIANPDMDIFSLNDDGTLLSVSFSDGSLKVYCLSDNEKSLDILDETSGYTDFQGGFFQQYFAFSATNSEESAFAVIDMDQNMQTGGFQSPGTAYGVQADGNGIFVQVDNIFVSLHPVTGDQRPLVNTSENILHFDTNGRHTLIITNEGVRFFDENGQMLGSFEKDKDYHFVRIEGETAIIGSMDSPVIRIMNFEQHGGSELLAYDPAYVHEEARLSQDEKTMMLFSKNQFRIYDMEGQMITESSVPDPDNIYDQQYVRDSEGSYLKVIYNDGKVLKYSGSDGILLSGEQGELPDTTYLELFETEHFRIESPLYGAPKVYDKKNGQLLCYLNEDAYLTYVTEVEEGLVVQYTTATQEHYGQLLDKKCKIMAELPYLCDVVDNTFLFDYPTGNIRQSSVYRIDQIIEFAETQRGVKGNA